MKILCYALPALLLMAPAACSKHEDFPSESTYHFVNQTEAGLTLDLYDSKADYWQNNSRLARYRIESGATFPVVLQVGKTYWMDWYNDTYTISNWRGTAGAVLGSQIQLNAAEGGDTRIIGAVPSDTVRSVMLGGEGASSEWKGTDMNGVAHRFVFRKDFTGLHEQGNPGATTSDSISYEIALINRINDQTMQFSLTVYAQRHYQFSAYCNLMYYPPVTGRDSLQIFPAAGNGYFVRRQ